MNNPVIGLALILLSFTAYRCEYFYRSEAIILCPLAVILLVAGCLFHLKGIKRYV